MQTNEAAGRERVEEGAGGELSFSTQEGRIRVTFPSGMDEGKLSLAMLEAADFLVAPVVESGDELGSASSSPQRAFGQIREAVARQIYKDFCTGSWDAEPPFFKTQFFERVDRVLALLGEAPPTKEAEQSPKTTAREAWVYINPFGAQTATSSKHFADANPYLESGGKWFLFHEAPAACLQMEDSVTFSDSGEGWHYSCTIGDTARGSK